MGFLSNKIKLEIVIILTVNVILLPSNHLIIIDSISLLVCLSIDEDIIKHEILRLGEKISCTGGDCGNQWPETFASFHRP